MLTLLRCGFTLLFLAVLTACASEAVTGVEPEPPAGSAVPAPPKRLTCPEGGFVGTDGGLMAAGAELHGTETPDEAVLSWMASQGGVDHVIDRDAATAWVLREDGTARARLHLLLRDGWLVHGYEACS